MQAKTLVLVLIAMVCGLVATMGISRVMEQQGTQRPIETVKIFVAATDIDIGAALTSQNVKLEEWPKDRVPEGAITRLEDLEGRFARQRLYPGEPVLLAKLMDSNSDTAMTIPEGYRACSIKVSGEIAVGNLIKPGDRVDVIVFLHKSADVPVTSARTILRDVRVWAVNEKTERTVDDMGKVTVAQTVSLLVTPKQVELLTLATQLGDLRLSLRRPNDTKEAEDSGMTVDDLLREVQGQTPSGLLARASQGDGAGAGQKPTGSVDRLLTLFEQMRTRKSGTGTGGQTPREESVPASKPVQFSMLVHTPRGVIRYDWTDPTQLPQPVLLAGSADVPGLSHATATVPAQGRGTGAATVPKGVAPASSPAPDSEPPVSQERATETGGAAAGSQPAPDAEPVTEHDLGTKINVP